jgi:hypothetical protein
LRRETFRSAVRSCSFIRSSVTPRVSGIGKRSGDELQQHHLAKNARADTISSGNIGASADDPPLAIPARNRRDTNDVKLRKGATRCADHMEQTDDSQHVACCRSDRRARRR